MSVHTTSLATDPLSLALTNQAYYVGQYDHSLGMYRQLAKVAERAGFMLLCSEDVFRKQVQRNLPKARELIMQATMAGRAG